MVDTGRRVLLIEDNPGDARLLQVMLADSGGGRFGLTAVGTLAEGIAAIGGNGFEAILLDLTLPDSAGIDTVLRTRAAAPHVPIIVMTGMNDEEMATRAVREGAQDYLVKGHADGALLVRAIGYAIERHRIEEQVRASLEGKVWLLKEIHHRVKNNLQIVSSLLQLQSRYIDDRKVLDIFRESQNRVRSMALIHERLYRSEDLETIDFSEYVRNLTSHLQKTYRDTAANVQMSVDIGDIKLDVETGIPCGLIITELVSNAMKYAFPDGRKGTITISLEQAGDRAYVLTVSDDGVGLPADFDPGSSGSLGMQLINTLTDQLDGEVELDGSRGTRYTITFFEQSRSDGRGAP
ncbi:MAG: response regulator [Thermoplasmata archaeon]|nr:response regulator [Thermoplasmata archaeon]